MFDVGFTELFLLAIIGLLVLGPERLPRVARTIGGFVRKARMSWISLRNTIESEMSEADLSKPIKKTSEELRQIGRELSEKTALKPEQKKPTPPAEQSEPANPPASAPRAEADNGKSENA
jgi:sec-independent protein translocase protein TatB